MRFAEHDESSPKSRQALSGPAQARLRPSTPQAESLLRAGHKNFLSPAAPASQSQWILRDTFLETFHDTMTQRHSPSQRTLDTETAEPQGLGTSSVTETMSPSSGKMGVVASCCVRSFLPIPMFCSPRRSGGPVLCFQITRHIGDQTNTNLPGSPNKMLGPKGG